MIEVRIPVSPEQADVVADHLLEGKTLGMLPDERAWIIAQTRKLHPKSRVMKADLCIEDAEWVVTLNE